MSSIKKFLFVASVIYDRITLVLGALSAIFQKENHLEVINFASYLTSKWSVYGNTMTVINMHNLDIKGILIYKSAMEIYSLNYKAINRNDTCEEMSDFDKATLLIILDDVDYDVETILQNHYRWRQYKLGTLTMVFIANLTTENKNIQNKLKILFQKFQEKGIVAIVAIVWSDSTNSIHLFTFNFFTKHLHNATDDLDVKQLYYKNTQNFYGSQIKSCVLHHPPYVEFLGNNVFKGPEIESFQALIKFLNISDYIVPTQPANTSSYLASMNYAKNNACDILFTKTSLLSMPGMAKLYDPIKLDHVSLCVPKAGRVVGYFKIASPFDKFVWLSIFVSLLILRISWFAATQLKLPWRSVDDTISSFIFIRIQLNISLDKNLSYLVLSSKIFIAFSVFYGCFIAFAYQSVLVGFLVRPLFGENLNTMKDVAESNLKIYVPGLEFKIWQKNVETDSVSRKIRNKYLAASSVNNFEDLMQKNSYSNQFGYICRESWAKYKLITSHKSFNYHIVGEHLSPVFYAYSVACNFPYGPRFQQIFSRFEESGLTEFWERDFNRLRRNKSTSSTNPTVLSLKDIIGALALWSLGMAISGVVFLLEFSYRYTVM